MPEHARDTRPVRLFTHACPNESISDHIRSLAPPMGEDTPVLELNRSPRGLARGRTIPRSSVPESSGPSTPSARPEPDYLTMSREWAARNNHPEGLTADQIVKCVAILRPSLQLMAREQMAAQRPRRRAA